MTREPAPDGVPDESGRTGFTLPIEQLIGRWRRLFANLAQRYRLDAVELNEIEQDVRIRLWRHAERQPEAGTAPSYVYGAVMSTVMDLLRTRRVHSGRRVSLDDVSSMLLAAPDQPLVFGSAGVEVPCQIRAHPTRAEGSWNRRSSGSVRRRCFQTWISTERRCPLT